MSKYTPHGLRHLKKPIKIPSPQRKGLKPDDLTTQYNREILLLYLDLAVDTSERILDCDIKLSERLKIQAAQNNLYGLSEIVKTSLRDKTVEIHEDRVYFISEVVALCTLVKPKFFKKIQKWFVERIKSINGITK